MVNLAYLYKNSLNESKTNEDNKPLHEVENDSNYALAVETKEHDPLPSKPIGETTKDDTPEHHPAEVRGQEKPCHTQDPTERKIPQNLQVMACLIQCDGKKDRFCFSTSAVTVHSFSP